MIYQNRIIDSLPALARLQIAPEQAMTLPPWLFWRLVSADQKDRVFQEQAMTQSVGMGMGGYPKDVAEKIHSNWKRILTFDDPRELKSSSRRMDRSRKAAWDLIGKVMGATGATNGRNTAPIKTSPKGSEDPTE